jgi:hypothetical protein
VCAEHQPQQVEFGKALEEIQPLPVDVRAAADPARRGTQPRSARFASTRYVLRAWVIMSHHIPDLSAGPRNRSMARMDMLPLVTT